MKWRCRGRSLRYPLLLWELVYDAVFRITLEPGAEVVCYADDTGARGGRRLEKRSWERVLRDRKYRGSVMDLGLGVSPRKTFLS